MSRIAARIADTPKGLVTLALLLALGAIWVLDSGFAHSVHLPDTGEELYLLSSSPLSLALAELTLESPAKFVLAPGRPVHLRTAERFVATSALAATEEPSGGEFLVRLYLFASELVSEYERRRVDPAGLHRALDLMASSLRVAPAASAAGIPGDGPAADHDGAAVAETPAVAADAVAAPVAVAPVAETPVAEAPEPANPKRVDAKPAAAAKRERAKAEGRQARAAEKPAAKPDAPAAAKKAPAEPEVATTGATEEDPLLLTPRLVASAAAEEWIPPDRILKTGDRIVESLTLDLGFLVR